MRELILAITIVFPLCLASQGSPTKTPWNTLKFFVGDWQGMSQGEPGQGKGERHYEFALGENFLRVTNKVVYPKQEGNPKGEVHEDFGLYSYDKKQKKFVFRQFHVEGFVNEFLEQDISPDGKTLVFVTNKIENIPDGWRARETYTIVNDNEYTEVFELAEPQKDFSIYSKSRWKRVP